MIDKIMTVDVRVELPWAPNEVFAFRISVSLRECHDSFMPLPRDRELIPMAAQQAMMQRDKRNWLARRLAAQLANKIIEAVESRDPQFGYSPEENARFYRY